MTPRLRAIFDGHRDERASELFEIAKLLNDAGLTADSEPIRKAASQCRGSIRTIGAGQADAGRGYWGYEIADLRVNLEDQRHLRPRSTVMKGVSGLLSVKVEEYVPEEEADVRSSYQLLRSVQTDFYFDAYHTVNGANLPLRSAWHIDTHLYTETQSHTIHPRFHFQVGGERLDEIDTDIRGVFLPEAPRIPCAPLDAILALDFVLAHYCGRAWRELRDLEPRYTRLRKIPMQRYWSPYYRTLANGIDELDAVPSGGQACLLIPNIFANE
jgi:hypothetical protein